MAGMSDLFKIKDSDIDGQAPPSTKVVDWFHGKVSTRLPTDLHHRIGFGEGEVSAGDHTHNGTNSKFLFDATTTVLTNLTGTPTTVQMRDAINKLNDALKLLGAGG